MDKYSFDVFVKEKSKKSPKNFIKLIVSFLAVSLISFVFLEFKIFKNDTFYYIFIGVLATIVAYLNGYFKKPETKLEGHFDGKLTFSNQGIEVKNDFYPIDNLLSINIDNNDYEGKKVKDFGEFESQNGSHGINNQLTLKTKDNQFIEVNFKQKSLDEFTKIQPILISYYKNNLLTEDDLIYIMKLEYDIDKNELRKKLRKIN